MEWEIDNLEYKNDNMYRLFVLYTKIGKRKVPVAKLYWHEVFKLPFGYKIFDFDIKWLPARRLDKAKERAEKEYVRVLEQLTKQLLTPTITGKKK